MQISVLSPNTGKYGPGKTLYLEILHTLKPFLYDCSNRKVILSIFMLFLIFNMTKGVTRVGPAIKRYLRNS